MTLERTIVRAGLLLGLAASPRAAGAQELRVRVADALGNAAVGTLVSLVDPSGTEVASGIVGSLGRVRLRAAPGSYRILLRFPGLVDTTLAPRTIAAGRIDSLITTLPGTPTPMPTVLAPLDDRCELTGVPPGLASAWSETAKLLAIVSATEAARVADLSITNFTRRLSTSLKVEDESYNSILGPTNRPPRDAAARWPAPDVDELRSPAFTESHCFGLTNGDGLRLGLIGLTFMPRTDSVGLAGTVWIDPSRHRARLIEYRLAGLPKDWRPDRTSGSIELHRIDPGFWVTRFWHHRTPILEDDKGRERLRGFEEIGAEVMALVPTPDTTDRIAAAQLIAQREEAARSQVARMEGVIQDTLGYPVAGAEVEVMGTEHRTASETNGRFVLDGLPVGVQMIRVRKVGYKPQYFGIRLGGGEHWEGRIAIAKEAQHLGEILVVGRYGKPARYANTSKYDEFYHRRATASGRFLTREDIDKSAAGRISELFRAIPGVRVGFGGAQGLSEEVSFLSCPAENIGVWIDGQKMSGLVQEILPLISPLDVEAIEIYPRQSIVPAIYRDNSCAAIVMWTR